MGPGSAVHRFVLRTRAAPHPGYDAEPVLELFQHREPILNHQLLHLSPQDESKKTAPLERAPFIFDPVEIEKPHP